MSILRLFVAIFLSEILTAGPALAAVGSWNGVAFTAWNGVVQTSWNGTAISCAGFTVQDQRPTSDGFGGVALNAADRRYIANWWKGGTDGGTTPYDATKITVYLKKLGSPPGNVSVCIFGSAATLPTGAVLVESATIAASSLTTSFAAYEFTIAATTIPTATGDTATWRWIAVHVDADGDGSNAVIWDGSDSADYYFSQMHVKSADASTWTGVGNGNTRWIIYSGS